ncbi:hypothetical protein HanRHA438_Chr07g0302581 [Helianthus annuus]|nr:hypothetical protein HanIR_Chr07g0315151 [Helianthus annuus]KAJ0907737.1 hypothetical protein HanRHA438_Chr07g0302581 [Helianthus annuus]
MELKWVFKMELSILIVSWKHVTVMRMRARVHMARGCAHGAWVLLCTRASAILLLPHSCILVLFQL